MNKLDGAAIALLDAGFSVIPCGADKKPTISSWKHYQTERMTKEDARRYFANAERLAIIGGKVSGNLECLDIDDPTTYEPFLELLEIRWPGLPAKLLKRQTPSGGYHLIYRCSEPVAGNLKLAMKPFVKHDGKPGEEVRIETRGEGGYFLSAPSEGYRVIEGSMVDCPTLTPEEVEAIHSTAKAFDMRQEVCRPNKPTASIGQMVNGDAPGTRFNQSHSVADILEAQGWKEDKRTTAGTGWTRPGKDSGTSGVLLENGNFYVWSANAAPLESGRSYDAFGLFVMYYHAGDFTAAARELAGVAQKVTKEPLPLITKPRTVCTSIRDFLSLEIPLREPLLSPWLVKQSITMLYAWRGLGKSWLAMSIGYAGATGSPLLNWSAPSRCKVLYIDGELPAKTFQDRMALLVKSFDHEPLEDGFQILTPDLQPDGIMPNLSTTEGQAAIDEYANKADLIIVDNLSCLARSGKENEGESWLPIQAWALRHRAQGRSILFVHHSGKNGQQRGASRREDVLDVVMVLKRPEEYQANEGARFDLLFEKSRNLTGEDVTPLSVALQSDGDKITWKWSPAENAIVDRISELIKDGATRRDIQDETALSRFALKRLVDQANCTRPHSEKITLPDARKGGAQ